MKVENFESRERSLPLRNSLTLSINLKSRYTYYHGTIDFECESIIIHIQYKYYKAINIKKSPYQKWSLEKIQKLTSILIHKDIFLKLKLFQ